MAWRRERCRGGRSWGPPERTSRGFWRRPCSVSAGVCTSALAAASSRARGSPSRRAQIAATAGAFSRSRRNPGCTASARSTKRRTAGLRRSTAGAWRRSGSGVSRGGTPYSCSQRRRRGALLVTSRARSGQALSRRATSGAAPVTCSKLSSKSSSWRRRKARASPSTACGPVSGGRSRARAMAGTTWTGSRSEARSTKRTPSAYPPAAAAAAARPRWVLPAPAGPVRVSRRVAPLERRRRTSARAPSRPISRDGGRGRVAGHSSRLAGRLTLLRP